MNNLGQRDAAAYMALGMLSALYRGGDIPECLRDLARQILEKAGEVVKPVGVEVAE